mgnify:CR=1 FL=1
MIIPQTLINKINPNKVMCGVCLHYHNRENTYTANSAYLGNIRICSNCYVFNSNSDKSGDTQLVKRCDYHGT